MGIYPQIERHVHTTHIRQQRQIFIYPFTSVKVVYLPLRVQCYSVPLILHYSCESSKRCHPDGWKLLTITIPAINIDESRRHSFRGSARLSTSESGHLSYISYIVQNALEYIPRRAIRDYVNTSLKHRVHTNRVALLLFKQRLNLPH